jgi:hypothetical protein
MKARVRLDGVWRPRAGEVGEVIDRTPDRVRLRLPCRPYSPLLPEGLVICYRPDEVEILDEPPPGRE